MRSPARPASVAEASLAVGMLGLAQFLPTFALTLFAGHAADIYDRARSCWRVSAHSLAPALFSAMAYGVLNLLWPIYGVAIAAFQHRHDALMGRLARDLHELLRRLR